MSKAMRDMMKQAQKMQRAVLAAQEEMSKQEFEGSAGGGLVTARMNGQMEILSLKIKPEAVDPSDVEMLEDLVLAALRNAKEKASAATQSRMSSLTGGLSIPGLS